MKIVLVANTGWNIYNFRKGLVQSFIADGHEVVFITPEDTYVPLVTEWGARWVGVPLEGTGKNPIKDGIYWVRLYRTFRKEQPSFILSFTIKSNIYACLAAGMLRRKVICNVSGLGTVFLAEGVLKKSALFLYRIAFRFASFVFFQNEDDKSLFQSHLSISDGRTGVLPGSGIDLKRFQKIPYQAKNTFHFLMVSRLLIDKGVREYAEAAAHFLQNENVSFTLVGSLDLSHPRSIAKESLTQWIEDGRLEYIPHSDDIPALMATHDAIVLPSYREGTSRTLLEGAATGRALIASDVPGCREVIDNGRNGFLCEVKSAKKLIDKLQLYMALDKEEREQMAKESRKLAEERFDEGRVIDAYRGVINRMLS